jgi:TRAP-type transport system periplasmic protein
VLTEEAITAGQEAREEVVANEESYLEQMEEAGLQITRPDVAPFRERMDPAYAELRGALGDETWETWAAFVEAARAS